MTAEAILRVLHETTAADQHAAQQILALLQTIIPYWPPYVCPSRIHLLGLDTYPFSVAICGSVSNTSSASKVQQYFLDESYVWSL